MDPVTHGLVGATLSQSLASKAKIRAASITGFLAAMVADLDVFISSNSDALLNLEIHRQFTHSLLFIPLGSLLSAVLVWWFVKKYLSIKETYLFSLAGYSTAGILDYFTSYGVHLFWPIVNERYSLDLISVFDPLFSAVILIFAAVGFYNRRRLYAGLALTWMAVYLLFAVSQRQKVVNEAEVLAANNHHGIQKLVAKPTITNQLLWSVRYIHDDRIYAYGIRVMPFSDPVIYKGASEPLLDWEAEFSAYKGSILYSDIKRFSKLSNGYLIKHPKYKNVIGDGRYAMLPSTLSPLWGIEVDTTKPAKHVRFETFRDAGSEVRQSFLHMLLGRKKKD